MPLTREFEIVENIHFAKPMRAIFSGSSQSGKTHLIGEILKYQKRIFGSEFSSVKYYYPEYLDECPVNWHTFLDIPITYESGFPTKDHILDLSSNSLLVIDDNMKKVVNSELMRQLFNVISGKKNISVICVTQNYFTQGPYSRDIRNSANYVALFRNCADANLNKRVTTAFGLGTAYKAAKQANFDTKIYPYMFIDQTQRAQLSNYRLFVNIFDKIKIVFSSTGMKGYILGKQDFDLAYTIIQEKRKNVVAIFHEDSKKIISTNSKPPKKYKEEVPKSTEKCKQRNRKTSGAQWIRFKRDRRSKQNIQQSKKHSKLQLQD